MVPCRRNTRQRQVILEELRKLSSHPTAAELFEIARARLPRLSMGTVYRNLELLSRMGEIRKLEWSGAEARFDGDIHRHDHVRCVRCGTLGDLEGVSDESVNAAANRETDFVILGHRLEFYGICPACGEARGPETSETSPA